VAAAAVTAPAHPQAKPAVVAGVAPGTDKKPAPASAPTTLAKVAAVAKLPLVRIAKLVTPTATAATTPQTTTAQAKTAAVTPNQVIADRGFWQGPADATAVALTTAAAQRRAGTDATGSISPFTNPHADQAAQPVTLAYADPSGPDANSALTGIAALRAAAIPAQRAGQISTTVAVKRAGDDVVSAVTTASASTVAVIKADVHDSPWLHAIVLSPSVHRFLSTAALGAHDLTSLASLMVKPKRSVMMRFAADPNPGLDHDRFSGAAIVFVSTVSYPTRTALLQ